METKNKIAVVTGGTKGIGKAIVEVLAQNGFDVFTCARNRHELEQLKYAIENAYPNATIHTHKADLSNQAEVENFAKFIMLLTTEIHILVNNSGRYVPGQIHNEPNGQLEQMMETNLYSAYHLTRALIPVFISQKKGHIFNMCSTASIIPYVNGGSYCISKFALLGFSKVLREEMKAYGVKVTSILPGATRTASWDGVELPDEKFMQPTDVAEALWAAYQLSPTAVVEELLMRPLPGDI